MTAQVNSGLTYVITNVKAGTALDLSAADNTSIVGWTPNGGANQKWTMRWTGNAWNFISNATGQYLSIGNSGAGTPGDGTNLTMSAAPFSWHIWRAENDPNTFRIFVPNTHQNLDLYGNGDPTPGNPVTLWWTWAGLHQTWHFTQV